MLWARNLQKTHLVPVSTSRFGIHFLISSSNRKLFLKRTFAKLHDYDKGRTTLSNFTFSDINGEFFVWLSKELPFSAWSLRNFLSPPPLTLKIYLQHLYMSPKTLLNDVPQHWSDISAYVNSISKQSKMGWDRPLTCYRHMYLGARLFDGEE